ncbi:MAG: hypothetical protein AAFY41_15210 [Bacteroidota bacterium]
MEASAEHFVHLDSMTISEAATKINDDGIQILIITSGYNQGMKMEIPALKPAPIQVMYIGYHESLQTDFIDYAFGDNIVLTEENRQYYSENLVTLPPSYLFSSEMQSNNEASKAFYNLPEDQFVLGCLNHPRKLSPDIFDAWLTILKEAPNAVLWLYNAGEKELENNLRETAKRKGVSPDRIIFCGNVHFQDHYNRLKLIDLFLDTPVYNGHTTCLEALWMSVPILTVVGDSVSARMCASFLHAMNVSDMVVNNLEDYISKAVHIASDKLVHQNLIERFKKGRMESMLFETPARVKNLEKAFTIMWSKYEKDEPPSDINLN